MSIKDIEEAIVLLPRQEIAELSQWFEEFMADQWDSQIEQDMLTGNLNDVLKRADGHYTAGRCTPL